MGRHFFTGGIMPADNLIYQFNADLRVEKHWQLSGIHYHKTAEAWLANMDRRRNAILPALAKVYGSDQARLWFQRWRIFFMACSEVWHHDGGKAWLVSHYRMQKLSD
jgi:cyclopropane-fatty-acyl-phospholipid synthase